MTRRLPSNIRQTLRGMVALLGMVGFAPLASAERGHRDDDGPAPILQKYERSDSPGTLRVANTIVRSRCGATVGAEKCRFVLQPYDGSGQLVRDEVVNLEKALNYPEAGVDPMPELLVRVLVELSDIFKGAQVCIASGYRCPDCHKHQKSTSKHIEGHAADVVLLSIDAVDLASYLLYLNAEDSRFKDKLGVGYYPNQEHVHVDVRDKAKYWVDYSSGAAPPEYDSSRPAPIDAYHKHYDRKIAAYNPGSQCPRVENDEKDHEAPPPAQATVYEHRWKNVFYTEPPLRGSPDSRRLFQSKPVSFELIPEMSEVEAFK